jgi:hypothetical protein
LHTGESAPWPAAIDEPGWQRQLLAAAIDPETRGLERGGPGHRATRGGHAPQRDAGEAQVVTTPAWQGRGAIGRHAPP